MNYYMNTNVNYLIIKKLTAKTKNGAFRRLQWGLLSSGGSSKQMFYMLISFKNGLLEPLYFCNYL